MLRQTFTIMNTYFTTDPITNLSVALRVQMENCGSIPNTLGLRTLGLVSVSDYCNLPVDSKEACRNFSQKGT